MKKFLKITLIICVLLTFCTGTLAYLQRVNLEALYIAFTYNTDEIVEKMRAQDAALKKEIAVYFEDGIRDFTPEERKQIEKGDVTEKQMLAKVIAEAANTNTASQEGQTPPKTKEQKNKEIIADYVSQLYTMESEYLGKIEGLISAAASEYKEKRNGKNNRSLQLSIGAAYTGKFTALERECDGKVNTLLNEMTNKLEAIGANTDIIATIRSAYDGEKTMKRAYYMSKYGLND